MMKVELDNETIEIPSVELAEDIYSESHNIDPEFCDKDEEGVPYIDCRLRVFEGQWKLKTGDSGYDSDYRGCWSYSVIPCKCDLSTALQIADELIEGLV